MGAKPMAGGGRTQWKKPSPFLSTHPNTDGGLGLRSGDKDSILTLCEGTMSCSVSAAPGTEPDSLNWAGICAPGVGPRPELRGLEWVQRAWEERTSKLPEVEGGALRRPSGGRGRLKPGGGT